MTTWELPSTLPSRIAASTVLAAAIALSAAGLLAFVQPAMDASDVVYYGQTYDRAGTDVARAGDVNGDGYADFLIGAMWAKPDGGERVGRAYIVLGRPGIESEGQARYLEEPDASFLGEFLNSETGAAVAGAGDVDGDGLDDFLIGARGASPTGAPEDSGKVYLVLGRASADWGVDFDLAEADASFIGDAIDDRIGGALAGARDVNGDGLDDFVIGAPYANGMADGSGKVALFLGRSEANWGQEMPLVNADASFFGKRNGDYAGLAVAGAGDTNGDGLDDIVIGAHGSDSDGSSAGTAYLILGRTAADWGSAFDLGNADTRFVSEGERSVAGTSVSGVGDSNGDGLGDLLIGAPGFGDPEVRCGKVYLVHGRRGDGWTSEVALADAEASWVGVVESEQVGASVAAAGDVNGDGLGELLFGAELNQGGGPDKSGRVYVVAGRPTGWSRNVSLAGADTATDISVLEGAYLDDGLGTTVAGVGDVDGDGLHDFVAGASGFNDAQDHHGVAFLVLGRGLQLEKRSLAPVVAPGGTTSFVMRYTNTYRIQLQNAAIVDQLPEGTTFEECHGGVGCQQQGQRVIFRLGSVPPDGAGTVGLSVSVPAGAQAGTRITNTAWISAAGLIAPVRDRAIVFVGSQTPTPATTATATRRATGTATRTATHGATATPTATQAATGTGTTPATATSTSTAGTPGTATTPGTAGTPATPGTPGTGTPSLTPDAPTVTATRTASPSGTGTASATATSRPGPATRTPITGNLIFMPSLRKAASPSGELAPEEYAVLREVILSRFPSPETELLVISDHTETWWLDIMQPGFHERVAEYWPDLPEETITQLVNRNGGRFRLADRFGLDPEVILISAEETDEIFRTQGGWDEFYRRFPGAQGLMGLSRVGFSSDGKWALAYLGNQYHWLAGSGDLYLLENVEGRWTAVAAIFLWIS